MIQPDNLPRFEDGDEVSDFIADLRDQLGFSQEDMAKQVNVTRPTITKYEIAQAPPFGYIAYLTKQWIEHLESTEVATPDYRQALLNDLNTILALPNQEYRKLRRELKRIKDWRQVEEIAEDYLSKRHKTEIPVQPEPEDFGTRFKVYMDEVGLTEEELARQLGVSVNTLREWISKNRFSQENLQKCCTILKLQAYERHELFRLAGLVPPPTSAIFLTQAAANVEIIKLINSQPTPKMAHLIQYSSHMVGDVIVHLLQKQIPIVLFLRHPDMFSDKLQNEKHQKDKILMMIKHYLIVAENEIKTGQFQIFFYRDIATLRAIRLDDELFVGYYTHELDEKKEYKIHGHDNIVGYISSFDDKSKAALERFDERWQALCKNDPESGMDFIKRENIKPEWWE